jgi:Uma2 family endonuclease
VTQPARPRFTFTEYVDLETTSGVKHEYLGGHAWAMAGGSPDHARIAANLAIAIGSQLIGQPCEVYSSDLRIRVPETGLATYPDLTVVCGRLALDPEDPRGHTVVNPRVVVEVLSPSTEAYDRGEKLAHYKRLAAIEDIVLVAQDQRQVEVWHRDAGGWRLEVVRDRGHAELRSIGCSVPLDAIYREQLAPPRR